MRRFEEDEFQREKCIHYGYRHKIYRGEIKKIAYCYNSIYIGRCRECKHYSIRHPIDLEKYFISVYDNGVPIHLRRILESLLDKYGLFIRGKVSTVVKKCGKSNCSTCASGKGHTYHQLTYYSRGKQKTVYLKNQRQVRLAKKLCKNYEMIFDRINAISAACAEYIKEGMIR